MKSRLILLVPLLALFAFVVTTEERAEAASNGGPVEGELMEFQPKPGTDVVNDPMYQNGQALKFSSSGVTATETVTFPTNSGLHDVELLARASQSGGSPTLRVSVNGTFTAQAQAIDNRLGLKTYTFDVNAPSGPVVIGVQADNTATGRNAFVDVLSFPSSGSDPDGDRDADGISDGVDNCSDVYNAGQRDSDGDGVGNACDQCDNDPGPAPTGCPADPGGTPGGGTTTWPNCIGTHIRPGDNIATIINDKSGRFCVHRGTYPVSTQAILKTGDKLDAEPGTWTSVGPARVPAPVVKLEGRGTDNLLRADGNDISISWVDITGASGTGNGAGAIAAGSAGSDFLVEYSRIHENASLGISNMQGTVRYSEFFKNSIAQSSLGFNGSAVKGITEYEADGVYVHEEQGNGLWCDVGCKNTARNMTDACPTESTGCFWVHDSVVVNSNRAGIRYENSSSEALIENNEIRGNGITEHRGGIDIRDSQNAEVRNNILSDNNGIGVRATDSGRSDRVNLLNILVKENDLGGDRIVTCGGPVECINNTNVGTR